MSTFKSLNVDFQSPTFANAAIVDMYNIYMTIQIIFYMFLLQKHSKDMKPDNRVPD